MRIPRVLVLLGILVVPAAMSGCVSVQGAKDWWNDEGRVVVSLGTLPATAPGQRIGDFSTLKIGVVSVAAYPVSEPRAHSAVQYQQPLGVDLRTRFDQGEGLVIMDNKVLTKTIDKIDVSIFLFEMKDTAGNTVPACPTDGTAPASKPCVAIPKGGKFTLDLSARPTAMKRAATTEFFFPFAVGYSAERDEYFLQSRSHESEAPITFR